MTRYRTRIGAIVLAGALATALAACSSSSSGSPARASTTTRPPSASPVVDVYGDSLTVQAAPALAALGRAAGLSVHVVAYYGLAPCDLAPEVRRGIARRPAALVLAFSGNNLTSCMQRAGRPLSGVAYDDTYEHDLGALVSVAQARDVPVVLVAPPVFPVAKDDPPRAPLIARYARLAAGGDGVSLVRSASALGGAYRTTLPCLAGETAALGCHDGRIVVRDPASPIHFDELRMVGCRIAGDRCTYSAGAHRYARAILAGLAGVAGLGARAVPATTAIPVDETRIH